MDTALTVIIAAGVLHNFAKLNNEQEAPPAEGIEHNVLEEMIQMGQVPPINPNAEDHANRDIRNGFINKDLFKHKLQRERCIHVQTNAVRSS
jgi:hypothetical protein